MLRTGSGDNCELHSGDSRQYCEDGRCLSVMTATRYTAYCDEGSTLQYQPASVVNPTS